MGRLFKINDYQKLRELFGELLKEAQRIKSEGDLKQRKFIENYGVKVDQVHAVVLERNKKFKSAPYSGFINPHLLQKQMRMADQPLK